jgi:hypothetical protein
VSELLLKLDEGLALLVHGCCLVLELRVGVVQVAVQVAVLPPQLFHFNLDLFERFGEACGGTFGLPQTLQPLANRRHHGCGRGRGLVGRRRRRRSAVSSGG